MILNSMLVSVQFRRPAWRVLTGRRDGRVSNVSEPLAFLPPPFADFNRLQQMFNAKGLDTTDLVALSGKYLIHVVFILTVRKENYLLLTFDQLICRRTHTWKGTLRHILQQAIQLYRKRWRRSFVGLKVCRLAKKPVPQPGKPTNNSWDGPVWTPALQVW